SRGCRPCAAPCSTRMSFSTIETTMKHYDDTPLDPESLLDRREFLGKMGTGLGSIALAWLLAEEAAASGAGSAAKAAEPLALRPAHFPAKAKRVVQIFCPGAASQMDLW